MHVRLACSCPDFLRNLDFCDGVADCARNCTTAHVMLAVVMVPFLLLFPALHADVRT